MLELRNIHKRYSSMDCGADRRRASQEIATRGVSRAVVSFPTSLAASSSWAVFSVSHEQCIEHSLPTFPILKTQALQSLEIGSALTYHVGINQIMVRIRSWPDCSRGWMTTWTEAVCATRELYRRLADCSRQPASRHCTLGLSSSGSNPSPEPVPQRRTSRKTGRSQPVGATLACSLLAGVSKPKVFRGR